MKRHLRILLLYTQNSIKISLDHTFSAIVFVLSKFLRFGMSALFIYFLLEKTQFLAGYTLAATMLIYVTYNLIDSITQQLFREVNRFRQLIISGDFDTVLIKPVHPFTKILFGGFDILDTLPTLTYAGLCMYLISIIPGIYEQGIALYIGLILNGILITTAFYISILAVGILSTEVDHAIMIYRDMARLGGFPIEIYAEPLRTVLTFVIPIGVMFSFPVQVLLGLLSPTMVALSFGVGVVAIVGSLQLWKLALAKYQSASS